MAFVLEPVSAGFVRAKDIQSRKVLMAEYILMAFIILVKLTQIPVDVLPNLLQVYAIDAMEPVSTVIRCILTIPQARA